MTVSFIGVVITWAIWLAGWAVRVWGDQTQVGHGISQRPTTPHQRAVRLIHLGRCALFLFVIATTHILYHRRDLLEVPMVRLGLVLIPFYVLLEHLTTTQPSSQMRAYTWSWRRVITCIALVTASGVLVSICLR